MKSIFAIVLISFSVSIPALADFSGIWSGTFEARCHGDAMTCWNSNWSGTTSIALNKDKTHLTIKMTDANFAKVMSASFEIRNKDELWTCADNFTNSDEKSCNKKFWQKAGSLQEFPSSVIFDMSILVHTETGDKWAKWSGFLDYKRGKFFFTQWAGLPYTYNLNNGFYFNGEFMPQGKFIHTK